MICSQSGSKATKFELLTKDGFSSSIHTLQQFKHLMVLNNKKTTKSPSPNMWLPLLSPLPTVSVSQIPFVFKNKGMTFAGTAQKRLHQVFFPPAVNALANKPIREPKQQHCSCVTNTTHLCIYSFNCGCISVFDGNGKLIELHKAITEGLYGGVGVNRTFADDDFEKR